jgi:AraC family transcriptional regulator
VKNFLALTEALEYIERNLCEPIVREDITVHCCVSLSMLEKLFRYALHRSIKEYVTKRRITQAAEDLLKTDRSITEIAMKYQYNSPEVFSRSFCSVWRIPPSQFRSKWKFSGIFPKHDYKYKEGDDFEMARKKVDISDAYDFFRKNRGTYVICFDIRELMTINAVSSKAGDLAILETAARIDNVATEDMLVLRIGGDEFALVTGIGDLEAVKQLAGRVAARNGETISCSGRQFPLTLWVGITKIPEDSLRYSEFFLDMHKAIIASKA